jgi:hypothetical protein
MRVADLGGLIDRGEQRRDQHDRDDPVDGRRDHFAKRQNGVEVAAESGDPGAHHKRDRQQEAERRNQPEAGGTGAGSVRLVLFGRRRRLDVSARRRRA